MFVLFFELQIYCFFCFCRNLRAFFLKKMYDVLFASLLSGAFLRFFCVMNICVGLILPVDVLDKY